MPASVSVPAVVVTVRFPLAGITAVYHTSCAPDPQLGTATVEAVALATVPAVFTQVAPTVKAVAPQGLLFAGWAWMSEGAKHAIRAVASRGPMVELRAPAILITRVIWSGGWWLSYVCFVFGRDWES